MKVYMILEKCDGKISLIHASVDPSGLSGQVHDLRKEAYEQSDSDDYEPGEDWPIYLYGSIESGRVPSLKTLWDKWGGDEAATSCAQFESAKG